MQTNDGAAKRAAEELKRRGWQIDPATTVRLTMNASRWLPDARRLRVSARIQARVVTGVADDSLADIEAAIAAAVGMVLH